MSRSLPLQARHLVQALGQLRDAVEVIDSDGRIQFVNPAWRRLAGVGDQAILGMATDEVFPSRTRDAATIGERCAQLDGLGSWVGRVSSWRADGGAVEQDVSLSAIRDGTGRVTHIVAVRRDLTGRTDAVGDAGGEAEPDAAATKASFCWELNRDRAVFSAEWCEFTGLPEASVEGRIETWLGRVHPDDEEIVRSTLDEFLAGRLPRLVVEHRVSHVDGHWTWVRLVGEVERDERGWPVRLRGELRAVPAGLATRTRLSFLADHDGLTGLANRVCFTLRMERERARAQSRGSAGWAVLLVDLDRFSSINDAMGHAVGDRVLVKFASRLRACLRGGDLPARLGGDEFGVLLSDVHSLEVAERVAERILTSLAVPVDVDLPGSPAGRKVHLRATVGVALGDPGADADQALRDADLALDHAKATCRGRYHVFDPALQVRAIQRQGLEADLHRALARHELFVVYQPIVNLKTRIISGFEALLRWRHPTRGLVSPSEFIPIAEDAGLIHGIWSWVVEQAAWQARAWKDLRPRAPPYVSVNLSPTQFARAGLIEHVQHVLERTQLPASCLKMELTESALVQDAVRAAEIIDALRAIGVRVSLDDFGTGFASLSYLHRFRFDTLKIDRAFVKPLEEEGAEAPIVQSVVAMSAHLGMDEVVAEGVENETQLAKLEAYGCSHVQGFLFSRPLGSVDAEAFLQRWQA